MEIQSIKKLCLYRFGILLFLFLVPAISFGLEIVAENPDHFRQTSTGNRFGGPFDNLVVGLEVTPNPKSDPGEVGDSLVVSATQTDSITSAEVSIGFSQFNTVIPELENLYFGNVSYTAGLVGSWEIEVVNNHPSVTNSPVILNSPEVGLTGAIEPVNSMRLTGNLSGGFSLEWNKGEDADGVQITIDIINADGTPTNIHNVTFGSALSTYDIPEVLNSTGTVLQEGETYLVGVFTTKRRSDASLLSTAQAWFEFTPTVDSINAFLPTVDGDGVYNFEVEINNADEFYAIDPFVAIGYDYAVGDGDPFFAAAVLPFVGDNLFELWLFDSTGVPFLVDAAITAGELIDFQVLVGAEGVDAFRILGIETSALLDPADPTAFVTDVRFVDTGTFTGTMTPITEFVDTAVPSPSSLILFSVGLLGFGLQVRKKRERVS